MKLLSILVIITLLFSSVKAQVKRAYHKNALLKYQVNTKDGRLDGTYTSWYLNGKKKAEGQFKNNQRIGYWRIWNPEGVLRVHRDYQNHYQFTTLSNQDNNGNLLPMLAISKYDLTKNKEGYISYPATENENVYWERMIWRKVENNEANTPLFGGRIVHQMFNKLVNAKAIKLYSPDSEKLKEVLSVEKRKEVLQIALGAEKFAGFYIKEVHFFDLTRRIVESRILAICPYIKMDDEDQALCWLKYEDIRPILAEFPMGTPYNTMIETIEDWMHFRHFQSVIEKETNVYDRKIEVYAKTEEAIIKEQERIEMGLLDLEHDFWLLQEIK